MTIKFLDVGATFTELQQEIETAICRVLKSGYFVGGPELKAFESDFARYCNSQKCVGVGSGLEALIISLKVLGVGKNDEVLVPSNTYIATWLAVSAVGANPVPIEPKDGLYTISAPDCEKAITSKTKAVIPVHLYGQVTDMNPFKALSLKYGLKIVEDAAQAHGAKYHDQPIGAIGDLTCWSFYPGKNLGAFGDGGAITGNDHSLVDAARVYANYGSQKKYINDVRGVNSRLDPIQAAVLSVKLKVLDEWNDRRKKQAETYSEQLAGSNLNLPKTVGWSDDVWHLYVIRSDTRDKLAEHLTKRGIQTIIHYPVPPHLQKAYSSLGYKKGDIPVAEAYANQVLSLPLGPHMNDGDQARVVSEILKFESV